MKFNAVVLLAVAGFVHCGVTHSQDSSSERKPELSAARLAEISAQRKALAKDTSGEPTLQDYFRVVSSPSASGSKTWTLQTSVRVLRLGKSKSTITLVATHHFGTPGYWRSLSAVLARSRVVLNEGIEGLNGYQETEGAREVEGGERAAGDRLGDVLVRYSRVLSQIGGFVEEIVWELDAWREGWIRADLDWNEFKAQLEAKPEGKWSTELLAPLAKYVRELEALKPDSLSDAWRARAVQDYVASVLQKLPILKSPESGAWRELGAARERVVMVKLREVLRNAGDDPASVAIRYGASHLPNIESAIRASGKVTLISHVWVDVLSVRQHGPRPAAEEE